MIKLTNILNEGKDFKRVKKDKYGNHLEPQFKKGDKVTYLGNKAVITKVNRESSGVYSYDVDYYKGNGRTKASNIFNKDGKTIQLESVNEGNEPEIITQLRDVLKSGYKSIKDPKSGKKMKVDTFSASAIVGVYDKLNSSNQEKFVKQGLLGMQSLAFKVLK